MKKRKIVSDNIDEYIKLPIVIDSDDKFTDVLKETLDNYEQWLISYLYKSEGCIKELSDIKKVDQI